MKKKIDLRKSISEHLGALSVHIDSEKNQKATESEDEVAETRSDSSKIKVLRVLTDEEVCALFIMINHSFTDKFYDGPRLECAQLAAEYWHSK